MNYLFHCEGDDGQMYQAFHKALNSPPHQQQLLKAEDLQDDKARASIVAAIVWLPPDDFFDGLINLKHVYALAAGVDQLLKHPSLPHGVEIIRLQDAGMATQMAEYVLYGVLRAQRNFHQFDVAQTQSRWLHGLPVRAASDMQVGILGAGVLASNVARRLVLNGYPTSCWSRTQKEPVNGITYFNGLDALPKFLSQTNVLVCLLALTEQTVGIMNSTLFSQLPEGAFIINCARGEHLVDVDLLNALDENHLSGAMLDVFHNEPLAMNHPFWAHPAITVTPHDAARSLEAQSVTQIMRSISQVASGETPDGLVDRTRGY